MRRKRMLRAPLSSDRERAGGRIGTPHRTPMIRLRPEHALLLVIGLLLMTALPARAQQDGILQIGDPIHRFLERQYAAGRLGDAVLWHKPLSAYQAQAYLDTLALSEDRLSSTDRLLLARFRGTAPRAGAAMVNRYVPFLYVNGDDFLSVEGPNYALRLEPTAYLSIGRATHERPGRETAAYRTYQNTRGVRASGHLGPNIYFESRLEENQVVMPRHDFQLPTAPRLNNLVKREGNHLDYMLATGMLGVRTEFFDIRFGRDRNRWGPGENSMLLSNYAAVYDQLQIRTRVWRLEYTNLFAAFSDLSPFRREHRDTTLPRKFGAFHQLAINIPGRVKLSLFENVIFAPDSVRGDLYDVSYLNPIIFYRAVEHDRGSPDNVQLGAGLSWRPINGIDLYGQLLISELVFGHLFSGEGNFENRQGYMLGFHLADLAAPGTSLRYEYSRARPFLYSHRHAVTAFVHSNDVLGHPAGQNMIDHSLFLDWQITARSRFAANLARTVRGRDTDENIGGNPLRSYREGRERRRGFFTGDGIRVGEWLVETHAGYEILPKMHLEGALRFRSWDDAELGYEAAIEPMLLMRWGIPLQSRRW
jgi:hypothetical protein